MNSIGDVLKQMGWDEKLRQLAKRVERNVPEHGNPLKFHEEKSEISETLKSMSKVENL